MKVDRSSELTKRMDNLFFDCADGIGCYKDFKH